MPIEIRVAGEDDLGALAAIEADADLRYAESVHPEMAHGATIPDDVARRAIAAGRVSVATVDGEVVGFVVVVRSGDDACIGQISVRRSAGGLGVGAALMDHVIRRARADGERGIVLNTQADVPWNQPWYERFGFAVVDPADWSPDMHQIVREQTAAGLDWTTRVHMRLDLRRS